MDDAAREYFRTIEERFIERRGRALLLSPADVARVADWHRQGIPLQAVTEAIDTHFERMARRGREPRRAVTLAFLEDDVLDAWAGVKRRKLGRATVPAPGSPPAAGHALATRDEHARICAALRDAAQALAAGDEMERRLHEAVASALLKLEGKAGLFDETAGTHDDERAEDHLRRLERAMLEKAREVLGGAVASLTADADASLGEKRQRMEPKARDRAVTQLVDRSLRQRLGVPRLSLFYA